MRIWNQMRPGVFDGGYAFDTICPGGTGWTASAPAPEVSPIPSGRYIVEVEPPAGYQIVKSQDKNVDFGDEYVTSPLLLPAECVGDT